MASVVGWVTSEFASEPADAEGEWQDYLEKQVSASIGELPTINRHRENLLNRSFSLRWESGQKSPMTESFTFAMQVMVEGLKSLKI